MTRVETIVERVSYFGFCIVPDVLCVEEAAALRRELLEANEAFQQQADGAGIQDQHVVRMPLARSRKFLELACGDRVVSVIKAYLGEYFLLNQQNGVCNPPSRQYFSQQDFHRDLYRQEFVCSKPLGMNVLVMLDDFTVDNGATLIVTGSHKVERVADLAVLRDGVRPAVGKAGSALFMDAMTFHAAGKNVTENFRVGVNHLYTLPMIKQQVSFRHSLGHMTLSDYEKEVLGFRHAVPNTLEEFLQRSRQKENAA